jgi:putative sterol carrier protein
MLTHAADVAALFSSTDALELVAAVRTASDADLAGLVEREDVREALVAGILGRLGDFAIAGRLAGVSGVARFEIIDGPSGFAGTVQVDDGAIATAAVGAPLDVTLRTSTTGLLRLVSGERNAGMEFLAGRLAIEGDADLALALGGIFAAPGPEDAPVVAVDPRALDTLEVARELGHVDTEHLRQVMASGFRPVVLDEIFGRLPDFVNPQKARGLRVVIGFRLTGRTDDEIDRFVVRLDRGAAEVLTGAAADAVGREERSATVTCGAHDFLRLATGHLSPVTGVLRGQLKVRGDKAAALRLAGAFDIPTAVAG